jgi:hypothetical protein
MKHARKRGAPPSHLQTERKSLFVVGAIKESPRYHVNGPFMMAAAFLLSETSFVYDLK